MRSILLSIALLASALLAAQKPQAVGPPAAAEAHLARTYPNATVKEWKQGAKLFRAAFVLQGEKHTAVYTSDGAWVRTEHDIRKDELPGAIARALKAGRYGAWRIEDLEQHATPEHAGLFKVKVESEKEKAELFFLPDGILLKEQVKQRKAAGKKGD